MAWMLRRCPVKQIESVNRVQEIIDGQDKERQNRYEIKSSTARGMALGVFMIDDSGETEGKDQVTSVLGGRKGQ